MVMLCLFLVFYFSCDSVFFVQGFILVLSLGSVRNWLFITSFASISWPVLDLVVLPISPNTSQQKQDPAECKHDDEELIRNLGRATDEIT